jgi:hypothetical protein
MADAPTVAARAASRVCRRFKDAFYGLGGITVGAISLSEEPRRIKCKRQLGLVLSGVSKVAGLKKISPAL